MILTAKNLNSSKLKDIQLDTDTKIMTVWFQPCKVNINSKKISNVYIYRNVTEEIFNTIKTAKMNPLYDFSYSKCFDSIIKNNPHLYSYRRIYD